MLGPARYFRLHTESVKFATQGVEHSMNVRLALTAFAVQQRGNALIEFGLQKAERKIFQLPLDLKHTKPIGQRREQVARVYGGGMANLFLCPRD